MSLSLVKAIFINRAPFEHLELDFKKQGINVLSAINGNGKTTILSHITDAFYELAKDVFHNEFEGRENKYYRVSSSLYNLNPVNPSYVYLRFEYNGEYMDYVDIRNKCTEEQYNSVIILDSKIEFAKIRNTLSESNNIKYWSLNDEKKIKDIFSNSVLTYFPSYRYETPSYLNEPYNIKLDYAIKSKFNGYLNNQIEVISDLPTLVNWFLDVLLDMKLKEETRLFQDGNKVLPITIPSAEQTCVWDNLNKIVSSALSSKHYKGIVRLGIGRRNSGATRIAIMNDIPQKTSVCICPSIFNLSAGELSLISIFGEILHQADNNYNNIQLNNINGIVLIDEVDKHLHITLQKEILPKLFGLFPNIQFIVSSHSPFLNMGLADTMIERSQIIDLDNNGITCSPTNNDLYKEVYELMVNENQRFADKYEKIKNKIQNIEKPIIISEGKTDWKHFKAALSHFKENNEFEDLDLEIVEYDFEFGDPKLNSLLTQYSIFPHKYKVIGIFDCDEANGKRIHKSGGKMNYGNNIWGMSIPVPKFREYNTNGISIEFLYSDEDLKCSDENGRRIFITSEFNEDGRLKSDLHIGVKNNHDVKNYIMPEKEKIQADEVIDIQGKSLALSKEQFATNILEKVGKFSEVSFDAFKPVFERLREILQNK